MTNVEEMQINLNKLDRIAELEYNWNGNEAEPFKKKLINKCKQIIEGLYCQPFVSPTARESIQFEWENNVGNYFYLEAEVTEEHAILYWETEEQEDESYYSFNDFGMKKVIELINKKVDFLYNENFEK